MKVKDLLSILDAQNVVEGADMEAEVTCGYSCDLLSWVMAHGKQGMVWATVQTHMNVIAVAVLMEMACVVLVEDNRLEDASLKKAQEEGLAVLSTSKTAFEVCGLLMQAGVLPSAE